MVPAAPGKCGLTRTRGKVVGSSPIRPLPKDLLSRNPLNEWDHSCGLPACLLVELKIAQLAEEGLTNREIAAQVFLSHRTAGSHLYRIFPKLNGGSRPGLAAALKDAPPIGPS